MVSTIPITHPAGAPSVLSQFHSVCVTLCSLKSAVSIVVMQSQYGDVIFHEISICATL